MPIEAKVILDSIAPLGERITTLQTKSPKFIDAECRTHRMLSQNSSSSRAIPFLKMCDDVYIPEDLRGAQPGMQGYEPMQGKEDFQELLAELFDEISERLRRWDRDVHKQHLNRYIEAWTLQSKVFTATEWDNFFKLRLAPDAQPEIQELARKMKEAIDNSEPVGRLWHFPYVHENEIKGNLQDIAMMSAARCARVSYKNHDNTDPDRAKDLELADRLFKSGHLTPFEHQAYVMMYDDVDDISDLLVPERGVTHIDRDLTYWSANFKGWIQHRKLKEDLIWSGLA